VYLKGPTSHLELVQVYLLLRDQVIVFSFVNLPRRLYLSTIMAQNSGDNGSRNSSVSKPSQFMCEDTRTVLPAAPYSAFSPRKRRFILGIVTAAGFFGPLSGAIYLPALPLFETIFKASATAISATVSVYMVVFAIAVSYPPRLPGPSPPQG
jgi:hypothetical protein